MNFPYECELLAPLSRLLRHANIVFVLSLAGTGRTNWNCICSIVTPGFTQLLHDDDEGGVAGDDAVSDNDYDDDDADK